MTECTTCGRRDNIAPIIRGFISIVQELGSQMAEALGEHNEHLGALDAYAEVLELAEIGIKRENALKKWREKDGTPDATPSQQKRLDAARRELDEALEDIGMQAD